MFWISFLQNVIILAYKCIMIYFLTACNIMLIVKCNKKISLFAQLFVCCHLFCLCADVMYLLGFWEKK